MEDKEKLAYTAGIIDGEGCISIHKAKSHGSTKYYYTMRVFVSNTNLLLADWLYTNFGGYTYIRQPPNETCRIQKVWSLYGKAAEEFLISIYKYLLLKKEQASIALCFMNKPTLSDVLFGNAKELRQDAESDVFYQQMRKLNKRGARKEADDESQELS